MKKGISVISTIVLLISLLISSSVFAEGTITVKKITFTDKTVLLAPNTTYHLGVSFVPEEANTEGFEWKSSNPKVATVDENGTITGVSKGSAKITVSAPNGSKAKATVNVKVQNYDLVFTDANPQQIEYSYGSGRFNISSKVKKGNVSIPDIGGYVMASVMGGDGKIHKNVDVTPLSQGEDEITIKVNKKKFVYKIYVSQDAFVALEKEKEEKEKEETLISGFPQSYQYLDIPWGSTYDAVVSLLSDKRMSISELEKNDDVWETRVIFPDAYIGGEKVNTMYLRFAHNNGDESKPGRLYQIECYVRSLMDYDILDIKDRMINDYGECIEDTIKWSHEPWGCWQENKHCIWEKDGVTISVTTLENNLFSVVFDNPAVTSPNI